MHFEKRQIVQAFRIANIHTYIHSKNIMYLGTKTGKKTIKSFNINLYSNHNHNIYHHTGKRYQREKHQDAKINYTTNMKRYHNKKSFL